MKHISDETVICRYMSVSAFLMLLNGEAFFPSIKKLREGDPLEASVGEAVNQMLWDIAVDGGEEELALELIFEEKSAKDKKKRASEVVDNLESHFVRSVLGGSLASKIAERRAAWCWFGSDIESAAMWQIYGNRGIAVFTTVGHLKSALPTCLEHLVGGITYVDRKSGSARSIENLCACSKELLRKPYFLKASEFVSESEVRVVIRCNDPRGRGRIVEGIDIGTLIREVKISPFLSTGESEAIRKLVIEKHGEDSIDINQSSLRGDQMLRSIEEWGIEFNRYNDGDDADLPMFLRLL